MRKIPLLLLALLVVVSCLAQAHAGPGANGPRPSPANSLSEILQYIAAGWENLTRSTAACATLVDPKVSGKSVLYLPSRLAAPTSLPKLEKECGIDVERLPSSAEKPAAIDVERIPAPGLLFLPQPYVVPGGMFNEMYGWDSYFIIRGLLRDGKTALAKGMVANFFFEIEQYGAVLNANRTYYLTRSQPPLLTSMIQAVWEKETADGRQDPSWLATAYRFAVRDYQMWTRPPHLAGDTGLSRYYDRGQGPVPELAQDGFSYYRNVVRYFLTHRDTAPAYLTEKDEKSPASAPRNSAGPAPFFHVNICAPDSNSAAANACVPVGDFGLNAEFYKGDRSMRESGFDVTFRFGPFGAATHHYAPVCLNSLLYKTEKDLERISGILGLAQEARTWRQRAEDRRGRGDKYLWDGTKGLFFDYDFKTGARSRYEYASTFYPLWAGLASPSQARAVARNLSLFEQPGGLAMSRRETKAQWDYPYGWAPIQLLAVEGLRRYGFDEQANRISYHFLSMVLENFRRDATIREKYNVVTRSSETQIEVGYKANVIGFGWTNGVFLELLAALPHEWASRLALE